MDDEDKKKLEDETRLSGRMPKLGKVPGRKTLALFQRAIEWKYSKLWLENYREWNGEKSKKAIKWRMAYSVPIGEFSTFGVAFCRTQHSQVRHFDGHNACTSLYRSAGIMYTVCGMGYAASSYTLITKGPAEKRFSILADLWNFGGRTWVSDTGVWLEISDPEKLVLEYVAFGGK